MFIKNFCYFSIYINTYQYIKGSLYLVVSGIRENSYFDDTNFRLETNS